MVDRQAIRLAAMKEFGFGPDVMKEIKVCHICGCSCSVQEIVCKECGAALSEETLFDLYKAQHSYCPRCDTVVSNTVIFCPECGKRLRLWRFFSFKKAKE